MKKMILITERELEIKGLYNITTKEEVLFRTNNIPSLLRIKNRVVDTYKKNIYKCDLLENNKVEITEILNVSFLRNNLLNANMKLFKHEIGFNMRHFNDLKTYDKKGNYLLDYVIHHRDVLPFTIEEFKFILENETEYFKMNTKKRYEKFYNVFENVIENEKPLKYYIATHINKCVGSVQFANILTRKAVCVTKDLETREYKFELRTGESLYVPFSSIPQASRGEKNIKDEYKDLFKSVRSYNGIIKDTVREARHVIVNIPDDTLNMFNVTDETKEILFETNPGSKDIDYIRCIITFMPDYDNTEFCRDTLLTASKNIEKLLPICEKYNKSKMDRILSTQYKVYNKRPSICTKYDIVNMSLQEMLQVEDKMRKPVLLIPGYEHTITLEDVTREDVRKIIDCTTSLGIKCTALFYKKATGIVIK